MKYCPKCGKENTEGSKFCNYCGVAMPVRNRPTNNYVKGKPLAERVQFIIALFVVLAILCIPLAIYLLSEDSRLGNALAGVGFLVSSVIFFVGAAIVWTIGQK